MVSVILCGQDPLFDRTSRSDEADFQIRRSSATIPLGDPVLQGFGHSQAWIEVPSGTSSGKQNRGTWHGIAATHGIRWAGPGWMDKGAVDKGASQQRGMARTLELRSVRNCRVETATYRRGFPSFSKGRFRKNDKRSGVRRDRTFDLGCPRSGEFGRFGLKRGPRVGRIQIRARFFPGVRAFPSIDPSLENLANGHLLESDGRPIRLDRLCRGVDLQWRPDGCQSLHRSLAETGFCESGTLRVPTGGPAAQFAACCLNRLGRQTDCGLRHWPV